MSSKVSSNLANPPKTVLMVDRIGLPYTLINKDNYCLAGLFLPTGICAIPREVSSKLEIAA